MNQLAEMPRILFIAQRDGFSSAKEYALNLKRIYLKSIQGTRKKCGRNHQYRNAYLESAYSARHIHRYFEEYFNIVL